MLLTQIEHPRYAQAFADHLHTLGMVVEQRPEPGGVAIYLADPERLEQAQQELAQFLLQPDHPRYRQASWQVDENPRTAQRLSRYYRGQSIGQILRANGWVSQLVFAVCLLIFIVTDQGNNVAARAPLMFFPDVIALGQSGQLWRWITPALVHFGWFHFGFNLLSWWVFGGLIERSQSSLRLLGIFLVCALVSNWTQFLWSRDNFGGLSGVVYGLLGYLWFYARFNPRASVKLPTGLIIFMLVALLAGFSNILPIANMAHLSGLVTGCLAGMLCGWLDTAEPPRPVS